MSVPIRVIFMVAMIMLGIVSIGTTYISLNDSILPEPIVQIHLGGGQVWNCSIFAFGLSLAIGMMLFALKVAIIDEQKRLNILGVLGLTIVAFISIAFNLDVLYRTADHDFFIRYSTNKVKGAYEDYLSKVQIILTEKREALEKQVAHQEGELDAEVKGLRKAPQGYGSRAREEDYQLTLIQKTSAVELATIQQTITKKEEADALLRSSTPKTLDEIDKLQHDLRVTAKDVGVVAGIPMPETVSLQNPLFTVFERVFDPKQIGFKEIFLLIIAFILDLGDIIGYCLVPNRPKKSSKRATLEPLAAMAGEEADGFLLSSKRFALFDNNGRNTNTTAPEMIPDRLEAPLPVDTHPKEAIEAAEEIHAPAMGDATSSQLASGLRARSGSGMRRPFGFGGRKR